MTFLTSLGILYLVVSLIAGILLTIITWEKRATFGLITFSLCALCFAAMWPLILFVTITEKK